MKKSLNNLINNQINNTMKKYLIVALIATALTISSQAKAGWYEPTIECEEGMVIDVNVISEAVEAVAEVSHIEYRYWRGTWSNWTVVNKRWPDAWKKTRTVIDTEAVEAQEAILETTCIVDEDYIEPVVEEPVVEVVKPAVEVVKVATVAKDTHKTCEERKPTNRPDGFYLFGGNTLKWQVKDKDDKIDIRAYDNDKKFLYNLRVKDTGRFYLNGLGGTFFKIRNADVQCGLGDWTGRLSR